MIILTKLLGQAKELNVQCRNIMSTEDFQKAIKGTIIKYKEIIFGIDTPTYTESLNELRKQPVIDRIVYRKSSWRIT